MASGGTDCTDCASCTGCATCTRCSGGPTAGAPKVEKESCRTCPNREQCHGKRPDLTQDTLLRLIRDTVIEVLSQRDERQR